MSIRNDYLEIMHEERKCVNTQCLEAVVYPNSTIKLIIYLNINKTSGWVKRQLWKSCYAVESDEFTFDYIKDEISKCYSNFPSKEINQLLNKI